VVFSPLAAPPAAPPRIRRVASAWPHRWHRPGPDGDHHRWNGPLLEAGYDIRTIQELLGHRDVATTMIYTHVLNRGALGVQSPLDTLPKSQTRS
jgi:integrase